ncbi:MAG: aspartate aminotransferase family protein [Chloroflexi bacterium]|nr:aspartate aminotransferase family protein [Chloroflexota bacterium]|tara:strand:+ start:766 stop:2046 length:1281 start_codon:yes stop_codon:yes gene_type:complete
MAYQKTAYEKELLTRASAVLPQSNLGNINYDLIIKRGLGARVWDESDNEYIDYLLGSGPMVIGHSHPKVIEAVLTQLENGTTFFATNEKAIQLAEEIVKAVPCAEKVRFFSTGSEATLYAMRTARAYSRKDKILKFEGGFHGMNDYALMSMAPKALHDFPQAERDSAGIPKSIESEMLIAPFNDIETTASIIESNKESIGGVIVEPFQRLIPPQAGFLQGLREVTAHYGIPLIFDEIVTGFRFSYGGAQEYYGVTPDICTLGKAVAGGFPLTAIAGKEEFMNHFDSNRVGNQDFLTQIGTLSGNPIAASAGLATLEILREPGTYESWFSKGTKLMSALQQIADDAEIPSKVVGEPVLFDIFFTESEVFDYRTSLNSDSTLLSKFNKKLLETGVLKGSTKFYVAANHSNEDIKETITALEETLNSLS